jgi:hypothetical protein
MPDVEREATVAVIFILLVLPVSEVWNMGYSAPWILLNNLFSSPCWIYGENFISRFVQ